VTLAPGCRGAKPAGFVLALVGRFCQNQGH
jgi:hypothetical protein